MEAAIRCTNLRKTYPAKPPVEALRGVDLEVRAGECFGLLGPNGAGKTTTVEILEGLLEPTEGEVELFGLDWKRNGRALREKIGVTLQETKFADKLTVVETLALFSSFYARGRPAEDALAEVELEEKRASWVVNLSGGQRQRLAVACALIGDPELLFLDEPTTGLDPQSRRQMWDVVRKLRARGRTILITTHYMDEAEKLCDRVAVIDHGRVIALGTPAELMRSLGGDHVVECALDGNGDGAALDRPVGADSGSERAEDAHGAERLGAASAGSRARGAADDAHELAELATLPSVRAARAEAGGIVLTVGEPHVAIPALLAWAERRQRTLARLSTRHASLEDVFVSLTGRHLRDG